MTAVQQILVLLALADLANEHDACCPTVMALAEKTGASSRSIMRALQELEDKGLLVKAPSRSQVGRQASTVYQLLMGEQADQHQRTELKRAEVE